MRTRLTSRLSLLILSFAVAMLVFPAMAFAEVAAPDGTTASSTPTISSDKADYAPGELVTLTGSGWQDGESVHINVNDDQGKTWSRDVDVTADAGGNISDSFNLPDWFVATYKVTATGASGTANTTFTDASVSVKTSGVSAATVSWIKYPQSNDCVGNNGSSNGATSGSTSVTNSAFTSLGGVNNGQSMQIQAPSPVSGNNFSSWSGAVSSTNNPVCVPGVNGGTDLQVTANYVSATRATTTTLARTTGSSPSTYGDNLTFTATVNASAGNPNGVGTVDFKDGSTVICDDVALSGNTATCSPSLNAGSHSLTAVYSGTSSGSPQFGTSTSSALTQTVNKKELTVTAQDKSITYGDPEPALTFTYSGFVNSENSNFIDTAPTCGVAGAHTNASSYTITCSGGVDNNYSFKYVDGQLTVNEKQITITPDPNQSKVYGQADPTLTYTHSPALESGDSFTGSLGRATGENVGLYAINLGTLSAGSNYELQLSASTVNFAITTKALTISGLSAQNKVYDGNTNATITGTPSLVGVVVGDDVSLSGTASGTFADPNVGNNKQVTVTGLSLAGTAKGNYTLTLPTLSANITSWNAQSYGFYSPVDGSVFVASTGPNPVLPTANSTTMWNSAKGGSTIPLKFNVFADTVEKTSLSDIAGFTQQQLPNCVAGDGADEIEVTITGNTSLRYDTTAKQWIQNWKTPTVSKETCYRATVKFADGSTLSAFFKLRK